MDLYGSLEGGGAVRTQPKPTVVREILLVPAAASTVKESAATADKEKVTLGSIDGVLPPTANHKNNNNEEGMPEHLCEQLPLLGIKGIREFLQADTTQNLFKLYKSKHEMGCVAQKQHFLQEKGIFDPKKYFGANKISKLLMRNILSGKCTSDSPDGKRIGHAYSVPYLIPSDRLIKGQEKQPNSNNNNKPSKDIVMIKQKSQSQSQQQQLQLQPQQTSQLLLESSNKVSSGASSTHQLKKLKGIVVQESIINKQFINLRDESIVVDQQALCSSHQNAYKTEGNSSNNNNYNNSTTTAATTNNPHNYYTHNSNAHSYNTNNNNNNDDIASYSSLGNGGSLTSLLAMSSSNVHNIMNKSRVDYQPTGYNINNNISSNLQSNNSNNNNNTISSYSITSLKSSTQLTDAAAATSTTIPAAAAGAANLKQPARVVYISLARQDDTANTSAATMLISPNAGSAASPATTNNPCHAITTTTPNVSLLPQQYQQQQYGSSTSYTDLQQSACSLPITTNLCQSQILPQQYLIPHQHLLPQHHHQQQQYQFNQQSHVQSLSSLNSSQTYYQQRSPINYSSIAIHSNHTIPSSSNSHNDNYQSQQQNQQHNTAYNTNSTTISITPAKSSKYPNNSKTPERTNTASSSSKTQNHPFVFSPSLKEITPQRKKKNSYTKKNTSIHLNTLKRSDSNHPKSTISSRSPNRASTGGGYANQKGSMQQQQLSMTTQQVQVRQCITTMQEGTARTGGGDSSLSKRNKTSSLSNTIAAQMGNYSKNINGSSSSNSNSVKKQASKQLDQQSAQFLIQSPQGNNNNRLKQGQFESPVVSKSNLSPYLEKTKSRLCSPPSAKAGDKQQRTGVAGTTTTAAEQMVMSGIASFRDTAMSMRKRLGEK